MWGALEGVGGVGRAVRRTFGCVGESVLGIGITHDVHAGGFERDDIGRRCVGVEFTDDRQHSTRMAGREMVQRFTLVRTRPRLGQPDHPVEAGDLREPVAARRFEAVHATHAEAEQADPIAPGRIGRLHEIAKVSIIVETWHGGEAWIDVVAEIETGERFDRAHRHRPDRGESVDHVVEQRSQAEDVRCDHQAHRCDDIGVGRFGDLGRGPGWQRDAHRLEPSCERRCRSSAERRRRADRGSDRCSRTRRTRRPWHAPRQACPTR